MKILRTLLLSVVLAQLAGCGSPPRRETGSTPAPEVVPASPARPETVILSPPPIPDHRTTADVLAQFGPYAEAQLRPYFERAKVAYPPRQIVLAAFKSEKLLELWARDDGDFRLIREYPILAASGIAGPKLRQGDQQVPEGIYRIEGLNPNSRFHLSMKLNYPNEFDAYHAELEGRDHPGSDIFIHGKDLSVGCLAIGDAAIEELFVLVAQTGRENVSVIITPHDPRLVPLRADTELLPQWTPELYAEIERELGKLHAPLHTSANTTSRAR